MPHKHKSRSAARERKKQQEREENGQNSIRSVFGYLDPTPFHALNNIEKEAKQWKTKD